MLKFYTSEYGGGWLIIINTQFYFRAFSTRTEQVEVEKGVGWDNLYVFDRGETY